MKPAHHKKIKSHLAKAAHHSAKAHELMEMHHEAKEKKCKLASLKNKL